MSIMMESMQKIMQQLKKLRLEQGLTQKQVASIINVSRVDYNRYENLIRVMPIEMIEVLADYYKVSFDYLLDRKDY